MCSAVYIYIVMNETLFTQVQEADQLIKTQPDAISLISLGLVSYVYSVASCIV